uniref:endothelial cell-specific chemotaxis regulator-like isoform X2 n=1 Tax=Pristiophorus japonicus TaxID=55135 RepID=UPI00398E6FAE
MKSPTVVALLLLCCCLPFLGGDSPSAPSPMANTSAEAGTGIAASDPAATAHGGSTDSPSASQTSSESPSSSGSKTNSDILGLAFVSTARAVTRAPVTGPSLSPSDSSRNGLDTNRDSPGGSLSAKKLILVLIIAMVVLTSLIVLRFKCRNYRKKKREAKDTTSDKSAIDKGQVTLISIKSTDTDIGEASPGKDEPVENGKVEEPAEVLEIP